MPADLKFILTLIACLVLPIWLVALIEKDPANIELNTQDPHISYYKQQLNSHANPDIVFFGSSRSLANIDTPHLDQLLGHYQLTSLNLSTNWFGLGLQYRLLRTWLEHKSPRYVFIEVPLLYRYDLHPLFNTTCSDEELRILGLRSPWASLRPVFSYGPKFLNQSLSYSLSLEAEPMAERVRYQGYLPAPPPKTTNVTWAADNDALLKEGPARLLDHSGLKQNYRTLRFASHLSFLKAIQDLCQKKGATLILLNQPKIQISEPYPSLVQIYNSHEYYYKGSYSKLNNGFYWRDRSHLYPEGSKVYTRELAKWMTHHGPLADQK